MQIFYLIRHGETEWNKTGLLQGHTDIELNIEGHRQARDLGKFLKPLKIDHVVSSDLKRAVQTGAVSLPGRKMDLDPRLREVFLGQAEGSDRHKMRLTYGDKLIDQWLSAEPEDFEAHFPGGESRRQGVDRLQASLHHWLNQSPPNNRTAFFTHGLVLRSFSQSVTGQNHEHLRAPNCSVFEFARHDKIFKLRQIFWVCEPNS